MQSYLYYNLIDDSEKKEIEILFADDEFKEKLSNLEKIILEKSKGKSKNIVKILWDELCKEFGIINIIDSVDGMLYREEFIKRSKPLFQNDDYSIVESSPMIYFTPNSEPDSNNSKLVLDNNKDKINQLKNIMFNKHLENKNELLCEKFDINNEKIMEVINQQINKVSLSRELYELDVLLDILFSLLDKDSKVSLNFKFYENQIENIINIFGLDSEEDIILRFNEENKNFPFYIENIGDDRYVPSYYYSFILEAILNNNYNKLYKLSTRKKKEYEFNQIYNIFNDIVKINKNSENKILGENCINIFLLEKTMGFNLTLKIYNTLIDNFEKFKIKKKKNTYMNDINNIITYIMKFPNVYGRLWMIDIIFEIYFSFIENGESLDKFYAFLEGSLLNDIRKKYYEICYIMEYLLKSILNKEYCINAIFDNLDLQIRKTCKSENDNILLSRGIVSSSMISQTKYNIKERNIIGKEKLYVDVQKTIISEIVKSYCRKK